MALRRPLALPKAFLNQRRISSLTVDSRRGVLSRVFSTIKEEGSIVMDLNGESWVLKHDKAKEEWFYYNEKTWESRNDKPPSKDEVTSWEPNKYATPWNDDRYPEWEQFIEFNSKRPYYHNRATKEVKWAPPKSPDLDVFKEEIDRLSKGLTPVPEELPPANLLKRLGASTIDFGLAVSASAVFGGLVYLDIESVVGASTSVGFSTWALFLGRDMFIERGTRSPGKKFMKLEIVRLDGQLPSRWNTGFRQSYLPVYAAGTMLVPYIFVFAAFDLGLVMFTPKNQRLGDFIGRTRVIEEQPDREIRLSEKIKHDDEDDLKE